jgi:Tol biopolymer transport system component
VTPARWSQIKELFSAALETPESERPRFLESACGGDADLRAEVERLLAGNEEPSWQSPAAKLFTMAPGLAPGDTVAHYLIEARLGEGGMGVVYQAKDTRLGRSVALKFIKAQFSRHWEREARAVAALNHPHIATLHEVGEHEGSPYLVMELVDGRPLRGPLPVKQAIEYGIQLADALAAAHAAGVVHRDLKPGNILVTEKGSVKVLDFGLAKLAEQEGAPASTQTAGLAGTPGYMAPEQIEGKPADARSDIFAFGCILYELLSGRRAFPGETIAAALTAVATTEPKPLEGVPERLDELVRRCLRKDPARRCQHMDDVKVELEDLKAASGSGRLPGSPTSAPRHPRRKLWTAAIAAVALLLSAAVVVWRMREGTPPEDLKAVALTSYSGSESGPSLSPDGSKVAFVWNGEKEDNFDIYVKRIGAPGPPMRLTADPAREGYPAWSPDDRWIAFMRAEQGKVAIILISPLGGPERKLTEIAGASRFSWTPDAKWLAFGAQDLPQGNSSIWAIDVDSGERRRLTRFVTQSAGSEAPFGDSSPSISPDGSALAFSRQVAHWVYELYVQHLTRDLRLKGEPARVTDRRYPYVDGIAWTANSREIVYAAGSIGSRSLWRVPVSGGRAPERLTYAQRSAVGPAIASSPPRLVYSWNLLNGNIWRLDLRTGERKMLISSTYIQQVPQYSPDGRKIAFQSNRSGNYEVWTCNADGSNCLQITFFDGPQGGWPRWSPDSRSLSFDFNAEGHPQVFVVAADGGKPRPITHSPANDVLSSWSHDGLWIYFASDRSGQYQIWKAPKDGGEPVQVTRSGGYTSSESPDGRYIYYTKFSPQSGYYQPGLFRMPAQGGEETQVLEGPVAISFGVTSKGVYFQPNAKTIRFLDAATGKTSTIAELDKPGGNIAVSPDDAYVVWSQTDRTSQDLMLVEGFR